MPSLRTKSQQSTLAVLEALLAQGARNPTYDDLAEISSFSPRTVSHVIAALRDDGLVSTSPTRLGPAWGLVLSVALGAESCRAALVDANGALFCKSESAPLPNQTKLEPHRLLQRIQQAATAVIDDAQKDPALALNGKLPLLAVATAWPCPIRGSKRPAGAILHPDWLNRKANTLPEAVADVLGFPSDKTYVLNDANAHALAVVFDRARLHAANSEDGAWTIDLVLRIGGGLGISTMISAPPRRERLSFIDSIMLGGARSLAGELAHLPIDSSIVQELNDRATWVDGLAPLSMNWRCSCGHTGHLEALASGTAWARRMEESQIAVPPLLEGLRRHQVSQTDKALSDLDDQRITYALEDLGRLIGRSLASPILLLDPHTLTLTGSFAVKPVIDGIMAERETWRHVFGDALNVDVSRGENAKYIGVRGAALAVFRSQIYRRFKEHLEDFSSVQGRFISV